MRETNAHNPADPAYLQFEGTIATITLNRPDSYNAINIEMARQLEALALRVEASEDVLVLIIRGAGKAFCAGGDTKLFIDNREDLAPPIEELLKHLNRFLLILRRMPKIVLTSVHGAVAGAGLSLSSMCDLCVAATTTRFHPAYAQIGVSPDAGGTIGMVRLLGPRKALQMFLSETAFDCEQAERMGLVAKAFPEEELENGTQEYAERLATLSPAVLKETKELIWQSAEKTLADQLESEMHSIIRCMETEQFKKKLEQLAG
ncbi:enoyl-CoA hydratase-related protein [Marinobacter salarius]|uniref:enoyl-CoA hydratase/isomerase family protein n=1 Tax=Marinobacter salarius TaxID=1420917 RepID=UPI00273CB90D|nr:enoyl-CoA hydratase-related protein [Marinobacter salarius]MDP4534114.1 enoyl-CoA hydratase-related protein [Marinobacter salarius]